MFVTGIGGFKFAGRSGNCWPIDGASGSMNTPSEPVALKRPANGEGMPPNVSHGVDV